MNEISQTDSDPRIRKIANTRKLFSKRRSMLLRDDPTWDFDIIKLKTLKLSNKDYKFKVDPVADGQTKGFQDMRFDDSAWKTINPGPWQKQGFAKYKGIVWYRIEFDMPEKIKSNAVELLIPEVDQDAWVWLNGIFIGEHNGEIAKSRAIRLDITNEVKWKKKNMLCIRVSSSSDASGVLAAPCVDILK